jgi:hypothetical protein
VTKLPLLSKQTALAQQPRRSQCANLPSWQPASGNHRQRISLVIIIIIPSSHSISLVTPNALRSMQPAQHHDDERLGWTSTHDLISATAIELQVTGAPR